MQLGRAVFHIYILKLSGKVFSCGDEYAIRSTQSYQSDKTFLDIYIVSPLQRQTAGPLQDRRFDKTTRKSFEPCLALAADQQGKTCEASQKAHRGLRHEEGLTTGRVVGLRQAAAGGRKKRGKPEPEPEPEEDDGIEDIGADVEFPDDDELFEEPDDGDGEADADDDAGTGAGDDAGDGPDGDDIPDGEDAPDDDMPVAGGSLGIDDDDDDDLDLDLDFEDDGPSDDEKAALGSLPGDDGESGADGEDEGDEGPLDGEVVAECPECGTSLYVPEDAGSFLCPSCDTESPLE